MLSKIPQKNCTECTLCRRSCVFESPSHRQCTQCIKNNLTCFFKFSGESYCLGLIFYSNQLNIFIFFQEQGSCNDLFSKGVSPVSQDDSHLINSTKTIRSLLSTPGISKNINSDIVHCDPLSCVASGSRCHTADYLKEMKDVDSNVPCLSSSLLKSPTVSTNIKSDSVHCDPLSCIASGSRCHTADNLNETKGVDASVPCLMYSHSKPPPPWVHVFSKSCANSSLRTQCATQ